MASRSVISRPDRSRVRSKPAQRRRLAGRARAFRRLLALVALVVLAVLAGWLYAVHAYVPRLHQEVRSIPHRVDAQLRARGAAYVPLGGISVNLQHAIVAIEDRRFYSHPGIDPVGMARALEVNITQRNVDQGGSTLEQQLVKRTLAPDDRSVPQKLRQLALAWAVDREFTKARVLELYLNAAYYGQGAYGAAEAARTYFATDAAHLSVAQAAFIAALPQAPSIYGANPNAPVIHQRWHRVLQDMRQLNYITVWQERQATAIPLSFALPNP